MAVFAIGVLKEQERGSDGPARGGMAMCVSQS